MADFTAFIAHNQADLMQPYFQRLLDLVRAMDIEPIVYSYQEVDPLIEGVQAHMETTHCVIAVATRKRTLLGGTEYLPSAWVTSEIALARALGKPIVALIEEAVVVDPLLGRYQLFRPDAFDQVVPAVVRYLRSLRTLLTESGGLALTYVRRHVRQSHQIESAQWERVRCEIEVESHTNGLSALHHQSYLTDSTAGVSMEAELPISFEVTSRPSGVHAWHTILQNTPTRLHWRIDITPKPLRAGERLSYVYEMRRRHPEPFDLVELDRRMRVGRHKPLCTACSWQTVVPTDELEYHVEWPVEYQIKDIGVQVDDMYSEVPDAEETGRLQNVNCLQPQRTFGKWTIDLHVTRPKFRRIYHVTYRPQQ